MNMSVKVHATNLLISILVIVILLLIFSWLIEINILPLEGISILVLAAVIIGSMSGAYKSAAGSGVMKQGIISSGILLIFLIILSIAFNGLNAVNFQMLKLFIAVSVGTFLGSLLGQKKYYKLRNSRKRRLSTTK